MYEPFYFLQIRPQNALLYLTNTVYCICGPAYPINVTHSREFPHTGRKSGC